MTVPVQRVVACVVRRGDELLLCQRPAHKRHGGLWEFPGGKVEQEESDDDAARRELREELGLDLLRAWPAVHEAAEVGSQFVIAFVPVEVAGELVALEHSDLVWGTPAELAALPLAPSDREFLESLLRSPAPARPQPAT